MTTAAQCVERVRRDWLLTGHRESRNRLDGAVDASQTTVTLEYEAKGAAVGARLSLDYEECGVWAVSGKTLTVQRGDDGTTAATHADNLVVLVNSEFSPARVLQAVNDELAALPSAGLFRMRSLDLTYDPARMGYDLTGLGASDVTSIYEVRAKMAGPERDWPVIDSWDLTRGMATTEFASTMGLILRDAGDPGLALRVRYKAPFATVAATDDVTTVGGLPQSATDVLQMGAALRLLAGREVKRNFVHGQGDTRRPDEVPAGAQLQASRGLLATYERRLMEEQSALLRQWPPRKRTTADR